jgi:predicted enzyme related to lactoylglutathione lyase
MTIPSEPAVAVTGVGGIFFRAHDPKALRAWYQDHFGVAPPGYKPWVQAPGPTVFAPFPESTDYWPAGKGWMINLRVADMDKALAALRGRGISVETKAEWDSPDTGRFARLYDPEGNPIELWQPAS